MKYQSAPKTNKKSNKNIFPFKTKTPFLYFFSSHGKNVKKCTMTFCLITEVTHGRKLKDLLSHVGRDLDNGKLDAPKELVRIFNEYGPKVLSVMSEDEAQTLHDKVGQILFGTLGTNMRHGTDKPGLYRKILPTSEEFYEAIRYVFQIQI